MRRNQGFALPIVLLLSMIATSILAYDLHRLQAHGQLSRIELIKGQGKLLMELEAHFLIDQMNAGFSHDQCRFEDLLIDRLPCQIKPWQDNKKVFMTGQEFELDITVTPRQVLRLSDVGLLTVSIKADVDGRFLFWERYSYLSAKDSGVGALVLKRSQLVQYL